MLGHIYLTGESPKVLLGNFIAEMKPVTDLSVYKPEIRKGVKLHYKINDFISSHPIVQKSKERLNPKYSKYSEHIVTFFYDHFLASGWREFCDRPLEKFSLHVYVTLVKYQDELPNTAKRLLPRMIRENWFVHLTSLAGINKIINQMGKSTKNTYIISALEDLIAEYKGFKQDFYDFFPLLKEYVKTENNKRTSKSHRNRMVWVE